jgi:hypothetical protein
MFRPEEIFQDEIESLKEELIQKYDDLGMRATGNWANKLTSFVDISVGKYVAKIIGLDYTEQLVQGREPGGMPPVQNLVEWIEAKPITPWENMTIESMAWAIAKKIAREGTEYFKQGGTDLIQAVITPERIRKIINAVGKSMVNNFQLEINEDLQKIGQ